jgi:hypothetical protein
LERRRDATPRCWALNQKPWRAKESTNKTPLQGIGRNDDTPNACYIGNRSCKRPKIIIPIEHVGSERQLLSYIPYRFSSLLLSGSVEIRLHASAFEAFLDRGIHIEAEQPSEILEGGETFECPGPTSPTFCVESVIYHARTESQITPNQRNSKQVKKRAQGRAVDHKANLRGPQAHVIKN